jgi:hypothetical protein
MSDTKRAPNRREYLATLLGTDIADVDEYQPGQTTLKLWTTGDGVYCVISELRESAALKKLDGEWDRVEDPFPGAKWFVYRRRQ